MEGKFWSARLHWFKATFELGFDILVGSRFLENYRITSRFARPAARQTGGQTFDWKKKIDISPTFVRDNIVVLRYNHKGHRAPSFNSHTAYSGISLSAYIFSQADSSYLLSRMRSCEISCPGSKFGCWNRENKTPRKGLTKIAKLNTMKKV